MVILLLCIAIAILVIVGIGSLWDIECLIIPIVIVAILTITLLIGIGHVIHEPIIDSKIVFYTEENTHIEQSMDELVNKYLSYESSVIADVKSESIISLVSLYPDLKGDEFVKKQIDVYLSNRRTLKQLEIDKINLAAWRWWLYFKY